MFKSFVDFFSEKASNISTKEAITFQGKVITYYELHQRSDALANYLTSSGCKSEEIIPLILERDFNTIIAMLGIMKAGCAFLPMSPITPCSRIRFILNETKARFLIANINVTHLIESEIKLINMDEIPKTEVDRKERINANTLAYVMYTSGSTGNPKGVMIEHGSMMNLFLSLIDELVFTDKEKVLALTDYTFDVSLIELLMPLLTGGSILLTEQGTVADGVRIKNYLENNDITLMQATPLSWEILLKQGWKNNGVMRILVGGEKFKTRLSKLLNYKKGNVWNMYGPTETSMWSTANHLRESFLEESQPLKSQFSLFSKLHNIKTDSVPLGNPLANTTLEILDENLQKVEFGVAGELYIGGKGLARGYLNNEKLTNEKFIFHPVTQQRLYKTGDLVIPYSSDKLCYVGRTDDQLKFGGIRVEAGEIESVIERVPFVKKAVVKIHEKEDYYKTLAAYVEIDEEKVVYESNLGASNTSYLKNIYDETYNDAGSYGEGIVNNCGWQSAFTKRLITSEELNESYQFIRNVLDQSDLTTVLEVGCGTGSLLMQYIDQVDHYTVVEISSKAIEYVKSKLSRTQLEKVTFINDSISNLQTLEKYSCIIVNSVIQYLPSLNVLVSTINQLVEATKDEGTLIIGDVRSLEFFELFLLKKFSSDNAEHNSLQGFNSFYYKSRDPEIVLSPNFFHSLKEQIKAISCVDISVKHGKSKNELNFFRFDAILHINKKVLNQNNVTIQWNNTLDDRKLRGLLKKYENNSLAIEGVPNAFAQGLIKEVNTNNVYPFTLGQKEESLLDEIDVTKVMSLLELKEASHDKFISYDDKAPTNQLIIQWCPKVAQQIVRPTIQKNLMDCRSYGREPFNPWVQKYCIEKIKEQVRQNVLSWVNPSVYVWVEKWPLSLSGKLDKKKLPLPTPMNSESPEINVLDRLQSLWGNITGDSAPIDQEFWALGVSSLCLYFFLATINEDFSLDLDYHELHEHKTLIELANHIDDLLTPEVNHKCG